ncbi:fork head domain-containing protein, partial [Dipodascopsis uninucleata]
MTSQSGEFQPDLADIPLSSHFSTGHEEVLDTNEAGLHNTADTTHEFSLSSTNIPETPVNRIAVDHGLHNLGSLGERHILSTPDTVPSSGAFYHSHSRHHHLDEEDIPDSIMHDIKYEGTESRLFDTGIQSITTLHQSTDFPHSSQEPIQQHPQPTTPIGESRISAYARLDFASFTFYVQTLQVVMGRRVDHSHNGLDDGTPRNGRQGNSISPSKRSVDTAGKATSGNIDVHLGTAKAISRRHARIFYNFANQRFEFSVLGRNGAFVDDVFVEKGATVQLNHGSRVQIGQIGFTFLLPSSSNLESGDNTPTQTIRPADAISLRGSSIPPLSLNSTPVPENHVKMDPDRGFENAAEHHSENYHNIFNSNKDDIALDASLHTDHLNRDDSIVGNEYLLQDLTGKSLEQIPDIIAKEIAAMSPSISPDPVLPPAGETQEVNRPKTSRREKRYPTPPSPSSIPPEYREKPPNSYSNLIEVSLKTFATERGMSLSDIYQAIQELFPYYRFAPYGWQNSVRHNLSLNKLFVKIKKEGKGWLWGLDEVLYNEKEAKKNRPLSRERKEQERREKRERERKEKEERERRQREEKERLDRERKEKERLEKERKEKEVAEKKRVLALAAAATAAAKKTSSPSFAASLAASPTPIRHPTSGAGNSSISDTRTPLPKVLSVPPSISKPQPKTPTINKDTLKALQVLQQTISAQLQNSGSNTPGRAGSPANSSTAPSRSSTPVGNRPANLGFPGAQAKSPAVNGGTPQPNAQAAALAKALVMSLAQKIQKPSAN